MYCLFPRFLSALTCTEPPLTRPYPGGTLRDFHHLDVWHKAHAFTLDIYRATESFPKSEAFGLAAVLRRGSANIAMKIADGCGKDAVPDYVACLQQARGMGMEVEYQLLLAHDLQFIAPPVHVALRDQLIEVRKMLTGVIKSQPV
jgi:four helix bundle protein